MRLGDARTGHFDHNFSAALQQITRLALDVRLQECQRTFRVFVQ
jgi:hypothetical protein